MFTAIEKATENFCIHQIEEECTIDTTITDKRTLIAYIDIDAEDGTKHRVYIASDIPFMQRVSYLFLEENESNEETLIDMTLETANLIVGSAKVIAEEENINPFTIGTPVFERIGKFSFEVDTSKTLRIDDSTISIAIKELHA